MRTYYLTLCLVIPCLLSSQEVDDNLLTEVLEDVKRYGKDYFSPGSNAMIFSMSSGWINTAKSKKQWKFEVGFLGNFAGVSSDDQKFLLNTNEYNSITFQSGSEIQSVASALGENNPDIPIFINVTNPNSGGEAQIGFDLPQGIGSSSTDFVQSGFLQASVGLGKGFEFKTRFLPPVNFKDIDAQFYGFGVQKEITNWFKPGENFPFDLAVFVGYTRFMGKYGLKGSEDISDLSGEIKSNANSWLFTSSFSTKFKSLNFYGNLGYVTGNATTTTSASGVYTLETSSSSVEANITVDPFDVTSNISGARASLGMFYEYYSFKINIDYSFQQFNTASIGLSYEI